MKRSDGAGGARRMLLGVIRIIVVAVLIAPVVALTLLIFTHNLSWTAHFDLGRVEIEGGGVGLG